MVRTRRENRSFKKEDVRLGEKSGGVRREGKTRFLVIERPALFRLKPYRWGRPWKEPDRKGKVSAIAMKGRGRRIGCPME